MHMTVYGLHSYFLCYYIYLNMLYFIKLLVMFFMLLNALFI